MSDVDISKMKVIELKKELRKRNMSTIGNKVELQERLQNAINEMDPLMSADDDALLNEGLSEEEISGELDKLAEALSGAVDKEDGKTSTDSQKPRILKRSYSVAQSYASAKADNDFLASLEEDDFDSDDEKPLATKTVKLSAELSQAERLEMRAKKFGVPLTAEAKLVARAERFADGGGSSSATAAADKDTVGTTANDAFGGDTDMGAILKKRQERFGAVSKEMQEQEVKEKLEKRQARFSTPAAASATVVVPATVVATSPVVAAAPSAAAVAHTLVAPPENVAAGMAAPAARAAGRSNNEELKRRRMARFSVCK